jgi:hypothetical protein
MNKKWACGLSNFELISSIIYNNRKLISSVICKVYILQSLGYKSSLG